MADYGRIGGLALQTLSESPGTDDLGQVGGLALQVLAEEPGEDSLGQIGGLALQMLVEDPVEVPPQGRIGGMALQTLSEEPGEDSVARVGGMALQMLVEAPFEVGGDPSPDPEPPDDAHPCKPSYTWVHDFIDRAIALFMSQYRNQPRIRALATALGTMAQALEDETKDMIDALQLDDATGARLDLLGGIVSESRGGLDDDDYRRFIRVRVLVNFSKGNADTFYQVWQLLTEPISATYAEHSPATVEMTAITPELIAAGVADRIGRTLRLVKPAGVRMNAIEAPELAFRFGAIENDPDYADNGFDEGGLARLY